MMLRQQSSTPSTLSTPTLSAEADESDVNLSWTAVQGAARFELWVWESVDSWMQIGGSKLTGTSHKHAGVTAGTTYYYTILAVNAFGESSEWSPYVSATAAASSA